MISVLLLAVLFLGASNAGADNSFYFVSIGDSITSGFNTKYIGDIANRKYSWSTGNSRRVASHFNKLKDLLLTKVVDRKNVAKSRSTSFDLVKQLDKVSFPRIDYLTILIGANDVCDWRGDYHRDLARFKDNVSAIITAVIAQNERVKIIIPAVPDMYHLYEIGKERCQFKWNVLGICPRLLNSRRTTAERQDFRERLVDANQALAELADAHRDNIRYIGELFDFRFTIEHTSSIDCFHPSVAGQGVLADITWKHGWFSDSLLVSQ